MGLTNKNVYQNNLDFINHNSLVEVYRGQIDNQTNTGWLRINLDTEFAYDGHSNLVIAIHEKGDGGNGSQDKFQISVTNTSQVIFKRSDTINPNVETLTQTTTGNNTSKNKANIIIHGLSSNLSAPNCANEGIYTPKNDACGNFGGVLSWNPNTNEIVTNIKFM